jgi:ABC-2 type transport system ATP-binding protein
MTRTQDIPVFSVEVENLTRRFGRFTAVDGISFAVRSGEIFGFLGANGAGKTTTIRMLCGLLMPTSGSGRVAGFDVFTRTDEIKARIGYRSQRFSLYDDLTVMENLEFYAGIYGIEGKAFRDALERVEAFTGIGDFIRRRTHGLPLGWKQRLALTSSLLHDPAVLFLDEPTGGVDPVSRREFWRLIHGLSAAGTTVFVTTHYMDEAEYCNRLSIMHDGRIAALDSPRGLKERYAKDSVEEVFVELVRRKIREAG